MVQFYAMNEWEDTTPRRNTLQEAGSLARETWGEDSCYVVRAVVAGPGHPVVRAEALADEENEKNANV